MTEGGSGEVHDLTIEILKSIRDELRTGFATLKDEISQTNARLDQTNARLDVHEKALVKLIGEVSSLNQRFDNFLTGVHRKEHDELRARVDRIEARLDKAGE